jgi:hypothetical protein
MNRLDKSLSCGTTAACQHNPNTYESPKDLVQCAARHSKLKYNVKVRHISRNCELSLPRVQQRELKDNIVACKSIHVRKQMLTTAN